MTFLLTIDLNQIEPIFSKAIEQEIAKSGLVQQEKIDTIDYNYSTYGGDASTVTTSLWYLLDECVPLVSFVCVAIIDNSSLISSGKGYLKRVFNPHIMFDDNVWKILPRYTNAQEFEQINNNL